jgi:hypothetical protein
MAFTWAQIRDFYLGVAGKTTEAVSEAYDHLTAGYRRLAALVDVEELYQDDARVTVPDGADFVEMDCDVYAVYYVFNLTHGHKLLPEESGMRGRARYLEAGTGKPPRGLVSHYARAGGRLYLRDSASGAQVLKLQYKLNPPDVTSATLAQHPLTPQHLDWALVWLAAANYYAAHPDKEVYPGEGGGGPTVSAETLETRAMALLSEAKPPKAHENNDRREWVRQRGYSFNISGR